MIRADGVVAGSFRDPSGYVFVRDGILYRKVQPAGAAAYRCLMQSGLYAELVERGWLVSHEEVEPDVLRPERVVTLSWPYEWPFGALKAAALLTLDIAALALRHDMILRDASAYNVQWRGSEPVFVDTLSFGPYSEGQPWDAYAQFCRHFLAPLALMARVDVRLQGLLRNQIDGVPLDLATSLLPWGSLLKPGELVHLHLHSRYGTVPQSSDAQIEQGRVARRASMSHRALLGMLDSLRSAIQSLSWAPLGTVWGGYYGATNYTPDALATKERLVRELVGRAPERALVWDLGANTGRMLKAALPEGSHGVAWDVDAAATEIGWRDSAEARDRRVVHLVQDLTNPSPSQGWAQEEREGLAARGPADVVLALALVHHLAIGNQVPFHRIADAFARLGRHIVVEWVPSTDSQVVRMLAGRRELGFDYDESAFEEALRTRFDVCERVEIPGTERSLWLLRRA